MKKVTIVIFVFAFCFTMSFAQTSPSVVSTPITNVQALYYNHSSHIARTSDGKLFAFWGTASSDGEIVYSQYDDAFSIWSPPVELSSTVDGGDTEKAGVAADDNGNLYVVWHQRDSTAEDYAIYYSMYNGTLWSAPVNLTGNNVENEEPSIGVSDQGRIFVVWNTDSESDGSEFVLCITSDDGTAWSDPDTLSSSDGIIGGTSTTSGRPMIVHGANGKMACVWHEEPGGSYIDRETYLNLYDGNQWLGEQYIADSTDAMNTMYPAVGLDSEDNIYVITNPQSPRALVLYKKAWDASEWPTIGDTVVNVGINAYKPFMGVDANNSLYIVFRQDMEDDTLGLEAIGYVTSSDGGATWSNPTQLSRAGHDAGYVSLAPRIRTGGVDVLWREMNTPNIEESTFETDTVVVVYGNIELVVDNLPGDEGNPILDFALDQNYPNPFNPTTDIRFTVNLAGEYKLAVYNLLGQNVRTLLSQKLNPGIQQIIWDGKNDVGKNVASGLYFYKLSGQNLTKTRKMVLMR